MVDLSKASIDGEKINKYYINRIGENWQQLITFMDDCAGEGCWAFVWDVWKGAGLNLSFLDTCQLIEASYARHLDKNPGMIQSIVSYSGVYDVTPDDVKDGLEYVNLAHARGVHIQDIAIRRILGAAGLKFSRLTNDLLQVRSTSDNPLGVSLSPFKIPFILGEYAITPNPLTPSSPKWSAGSVEAFYQLNRRLIVNGAAVSPQELENGIEGKFGKSIRVQTVHESPAD